MIKSQKISWKNVILGLVISLAFLLVVSAVWYWVNIWLPQQENRALQTHFDAFVERFEKEKNLMSP